MGQSVLIAAFSGRTLAQSARRAGYEPLVVDAFGDLDTREAAADLRVIDGAMEMADRLVHVQYGFIRTVVAKAGKSLGRSEDGK